MSLNGSSPEHLGQTVRVNSHGHGPQRGGAILITHVLKCVTDLIRCSGGAQWGKLSLTCVTWPWFSRGRGHFNHTCSEMCDRPHQMLWWCRITRTLLTLVRQWGKLTLTCVTWPWSSRGRGHFNDTCSEM